MTNRLFVYGTLMPGRANAHLLEAIGGTWTEGSVRGSLKQLGWGADMGYPAITLDKNKDEVPGYIFSSDDLPDHWDDLDRFEGEQYERVLTTVKTKDDALVEAYVYALR